MTHSVLEYAASLVKQPQTGIDIRQRLRPPWQINTVMQSVCPWAQASSITLVNRIKVTHRKSTVRKHRNVLYIR